MAANTQAVKFTVERAFTVRRPKFTLFKSVEYLDAEKLSRGTHSFELGRYEGSCCDCAVMARVRNGKIVGIEHPKCEKARKAPPAFTKKVMAARKQLAKAEGGKWEDIPVRDLITSARTRGRVIIIITTIDDCVETCTVMADGTKICMICCPNEGWCIGPSDPQVAIF